MPLKIPFSNFQTTKMTFTDLFPALTGSAESSFNLGENLRTFAQAKNLTNLTAKGTLSSGLKRFQEVFQNFDYLAGLIQNPVIQLFLNPQRITINKNILHSKIQTRGGFVIQFWGHDLETIQVNNATVYFELSKEPLRAFELLKRNVYQGRFSATQPFKGFPIVSLIFENQILKGFFTNFNYTIASDKPYQISYDFSFVVTEDVSAGSLLGGNITQLLSDAVRAIPGIQDSSNFFAGVARQLTDDDYALGKGWGVKLF